MIETIEIERMSYGPDAIGHLDGGKAIFVSGGAVPGDVARVEVTGEKPTYANGHLVEVIEPSPLRTQAKLPKDASLAISPWMNMSYASQLSSKQDNVANSLIRTAHMDAETVSQLLNPIVGCEREWGYRNKLEMAACRDACGAFALGFHDQGADDIKVAQSCPLGNPRISRAPKALAGAIRYLSGGEDLGIHRVGIRASERTGSVDVALWTKPSSFPRSFAAKLMGDAVGASSVVRVIADPGSARKVKRVEVLAGSGVWHEEMDEADEAVDFQVQAPSFFQVNTAQAEVLVRKALDALGDVEGAHVADLYSGVGTFAIPLAIEGADVSAIELEGSSARDFRENCSRAEVDIDFICDDVKIALPALGKLDAVIVDPPRSGLDREVVDQICESEAAKLIYVSCDPQTMARDIARLGEGGIALESVTPVDLFPQTFHVECVCVLNRR